MKRSASNRTLIWKSGSSLVQSYLTLNGSIVDTKDDGANFDWKVVSFTRELSKGDIISLDTHNGTTREISIAGYKVEQGSTETPWMPSATELTTADISEYFGYNYIANQAYTYYGESNIERLSRWDIKDEIFSFVGTLYQNLPRVPTGVRFLDTIGNEYTAIVFNTAEPQSYILINTDVNDEIYQGWNGTIPLNLFPLLDFERYRTRIIKEGQMELINLTKAEFKIKRKADFV